MSIYISLSYQYIANIRKQSCSLELTKDIGKASQNTLRLKYYGEFEQDFVPNSMVFKAYERFTGTFLILL